MQVVTMLPQAILPTLPVTNLPSRTPRGLKMPSVRRRIHPDSLELKICKGCSGTKSVRRKPSISSAPLCFKGSQFSAQLCCKQRCLAKIDPWVTQDFHWVSQRFPVGHQTFPQGDPSGHLLLCGCGSLKSTCH